MFHLNKKSLLLTVNTKTKLSTIKQKLIDEGCYLGYYPLDNINKTLADYIVNKTPNLYHFKYGALTHIINSLTVNLAQGDSFRFKATPKASIGPNINNLFLGANTPFGTPMLATLKLSPIPENIAYGCILVASKEESKKIARYLVGEFFDPLFFKHNNNLPHSSLVKKTATKTNECFIFCLAGLNEMISIQKNHIQEWCQAEMIECFWLNKKQEKDIIQKQIYHQNAFKDIKEQYKHFLWPTHEATNQHTVTKNMLDDLNKLISKD